METGRVSFKTFLFSGAAVIATEILASLFVARHVLPSNIFTLFAIRCAEIIQIMLIFYFSKEGLRGLGLEPGSTAFGIKRGMIWVSGFGCLVLTGAFIGLLFGFNVFRLIHGHVPRESPAVFFIFLLTGTIFGPIAEELFFRGVIYGYVRKMGRVPATVISTVLFVLPHGWGSSAIIQAIGGIVFAVSYEKEANLIVPVMIHICGNIAIYSIPLVLSTL